MASQEFESIWDKYSVPEVEEKNDVVDDIKTLLITSLKTKAILGVQPVLPNNEFLLGSTGVHHTTRKQNIPPELSQLQLSLDLALVGSLEEAIMLWTKHLHNIGALGLNKCLEMGNITHIDTYGTVDDLFINLIKPLVHLYQTSTCSNSNCSNKEVVTRIDMLNK
uniref:Uncharacterized protein n=1 Tax=Romanomermis culicivorax TaxID=13658 RepID=A0A915J3W5_ROMCU